FDPSPQPRPSPQERQHGIGRQMEELVLGKPPVFHHQPQRRPVRGRDQQWHISAQQDARHGGTDKRLNERTPYTAPLRAARCPGAEGGLHYRLPRAALLELLPDTPEDEAGALASRSSEAFTCTSDVGILAFAS